MNQSEFEADLRRQGYQVFYGGLQAGIVNPDHAHDWDARVMVIGGEITLTRGGKAETFRVGDSCAVAAGRNSRRASRSARRRLHCRAAQRCSLKRRISRRAVNTVTSRAS
jgi:hypothetical protein